MFSEKGGRRFYFKYLAENDNSKNQVYFGSSFESLNIIPFGNLYAEHKNSNPIFKAEVNFAWISGDGVECEAPNSRLILYPQYPEVRFSGFLQDCANPPSSLMAGRIIGRVLFFSITSEGKVLGHVIGRSNPLKRELDDLFRARDEKAVFTEIPYEGERLIGDTEAELLRELLRINRKGWIKSKRLGPCGEIAPCNASNCGGYTLEAELGITPNGYSEPDFLGWEVKQHAVSAFDRFRSGVITLMTPEPTGGVYKEKGIEEFIRKYGYPDKNGKPDRLNFGGIHKFGEMQRNTGLTLSLMGYDAQNGKIKDASGGIALLTSKEKVAAAWDFSGLITHWNRKHAQAVYVPSMKESCPELRYSYGNVVRLCTGTDFLRLLKAIVRGSVYYDPGIKLENVTTKPKPKRRSQFRIHSKDIPTLYETTREKNLFE
ncbi:MAG: MvaI/BcnI restriction endonuclease family protein [Nitrospinae bacterium]|nr:MvaI/BcnI restriction endonuclease family protein [Nitrospinota bacterium]